MGRASYGPLSPFSKQRMALRLTRSICEDIVIENQLRNRRMERWEIENLWEVQCPMKYSTNISSIEWKKPLKGQPWIRLCAVRLEKTIVGSADFVDSVGSY
nr:hypothetical protein HmN_000663100 [Hymenolepis microstoma]